MIPITAREIIGKGWRPFGQRYSVVSGEFITVSDERKGEFWELRTLSDINLLPDFAPCCIVVSNMAVDEVNGDTYTQ